MKVLSPSQRDLRRLHHKGVSVTPDFSTAPPGGIGGRILANSGLMGGARVISAALGIATLIITARALADPVAFGAVLFVHAYMLFFAELATFKSWQAIIRFGADHMNGKDAKNLGRLIRFGFTLDALAALAAYILAASLFGLVVALADIIPGLAQEIEGLPLTDLRKYVWLYCLVLLLRQTSAGTGVFRLFDQFGILALRALIMPLLRFIGASIALWLGWGIVGFLCVWFIASAVSYAMVPLLAVRELSKRGLISSVLSAPKTLFRTEKGLWPFVLKTNLDTTLGAFRNQFPSLLVMGMFGPALFAVFRVAEEITRLLSKGTKLFDQVLYPELSRLVADGRLKALQNIAIKAALAIGAISFVLIVIVLMFGDHVIDTGLGDGYDQAPMLAVLLLCGAALTGAAVPFYTVFYVLMRPGRAAWVRGGAIIAYLIAFFATAYRYGLFAAGWAALAGAVFEMLLVTIWARQTLKRHKTESR